MPDENGNIGIPDVMALDGYETAVLGTTARLNTALADLSRSREQIATMREALFEISVDHDPEPMNEKQDRNWCWCGNWHYRTDDWRGQHCTAALARTALAEVAALDTETPT